MRLDEILGRARAPWAFDGILIALPLVLRVGVLAEKGLFVQRTDVRAALADAAISCAVAFLSLLLARWTRLGAALLGTAYLLLCFMNDEHVRVFGSQVTATHAKYLLDPTFMQGSAAHSAHPLRLGLWLGALGVSALLFPTKVLARRAAYSMALGAALLLAVTALWPLRADRPAWRQGSVLELVVRTAWRARQSERAARHPKLSAEGQRLLQADLSGTPRFQIKPGRKNVLLVLLEGFSGGYLPSLAANEGLSNPVQAPKLDALAHDALLFRHLVGMQRQTDRAEYAYLCGDLPKLKSEQPRMTEYVQHGGTRVCLPSILRAAGYATAYLQAAPTAFMLKDQFMRQIGFEHVYGTEFMTSSYARNNWGVDDKTFFERAASYVAELRRTPQPFFLTLLTVGTHHPYLVPDDFRPPGVDPLKPFARSVAYADEAVAGLLEALKKTGALEDTLVLISGDESAGVEVGDDVTRALTQSWLPLVVFAPEPASHGQVVDTLYGNHEVALSILDYLGLAPKQHELLGRSLFRSYPDPRPFYFSNTHLEASFALTPDGMLSHCSERLDECTSYTYDLQRPFSPVRKSIPFEPRRLSDWAATVAYSLRPLARGKSGGEFTLARREVIPLEQQAHPGTVLFGGQYFDVRAGDAFEVELDMDSVGGPGATISLTQELQNVSKSFFAPPLWLLGPGDGVHLRYQLVFPDDAQHVEIRGYGRTVQGKGGRVRLNLAKARLIPAHDVTRTEDGEPVHLTVRRAGPLTALHLSADTGDSILFAEVAKAEGAAHVARGVTRRAVLAFGPHVWAAKGSAVKARYEVKVTRGTALLEAELTTQLGVTSLGASKVTLRAGESGVVTTEVTSAPVDLENLEAWLWASGVGGPTDVTLERVTFDSVPPSP